MKMSKHYRGHRYHRGRRCHGGDLGIIGLIIGIILYIFMLLFQIVKVCFEWGTAQSRRVGFGIIGATILIAVLIDGGVSGGIIAGLIIFFVILFAILLASIGGHQQRSSSSNGTNSTLSQRSSRKVMLNQYSRDDKTPYMQDDMNDYHQPFHEKADFDDQFAAMEAQVHSVSSKED